MTETQDQFNKRLEVCLCKIEALIEQIHATQDYSRDAELVYCLRELVREQIKVSKRESPLHSADANR